MTKSVGFYNVSRNISIRGVKMYEMLFPWACLGLFVLFLVLLTILCCLEHRRYEKEELEKRASYARLDKAMNSTSNITDEFTLIKVLGKYDIKYHPNK